MTIGEYGYALETAAHSTFTQWHLFDLGAKRAASPKGVKEREGERPSVGPDTIENDTRGDFSSRKLPPVLCGISSPVFTYELPTGKRKLAGPFRVVQWNYLTHPSVARGERRTKGWGSLLEAVGREIGGLTGTATVAVTTFVDR
ncbi:hypothetical protein DBV15_03982 [Temnothorax longispinosus]|uniref:Uncharacterized protein n=1 Tax=Temnothorax longispinosus TaxID=300112 RepID=A0A4S2L4N2_9HYME|nr:hypothetical protein DBV15_03982 [Temnothorax longispinosus]